MKKTRIIETNFYGAKAFEVLDHVHGQLSDGMWENSRGYDKYWTNFEVKRHENDRVYFLVNADYNNIWCGKYIDNPFRKMSDREFLDWYAGKLKAVISAESRDEKWAKGWWNRENVENKSIYLGNRDEIVTVADIYCVYDWLRNRDSRSPEEVMDEVFGCEADQKTIEKRLNISNAKQKEMDEYRAALKALEEKYNADKAKLNKEHFEKLQALDAEYKNA